MIFTELMIQNHPRTRYDLISYWVFFGPISESSDLSAGIFLTLGFDVENGQNILERNRKMKEKLS